MVGRPKGDKTVKEFHQEDIVKERGGRDTGLVTGFNGSEYRIYFNSGYDLHSEFVNPEYLELVKCPHE